MEFKKYIPVALLLTFTTTLAITSAILGLSQPVDCLGVTPLVAILLLFIGLAAGLLGGLIGTGGCSIILPIVHFYLGVPVPIAIGTTLFAVIFTTLSGAYGHLVNKNLDRKATLYIGGFGTVGVIVGSFLFLLLVSYSLLLGLILGAAFLLPAIRMIFERNCLEARKKTYARRKRYSWF